MIAIPGNVRVWLATGHTDMRRGFPSLARLVQESLKRDPHVGDLYVFKGRRGDLIKTVYEETGAWTFPVVIAVGWSYRIRNWAIAIFVLATSPAEAAASATDS